MAELDKSITDPWIGRVVEQRFRLDAFLGEGAVGSVYRASDLTQRRTVAVKVWNGSVLNAQSRGRFVREATALNTLRHPNIVDVYGYGLIDDMPYVAMEYLEGDTLEGVLLDAQPLETSLALDIAKQMLGALAYAHGLGVVHRDLKPDNVYLARVGAAPPPTRGARLQGPYLVKLLDYGLAKFMTPGADPVQGVALTMTGMMMGTPLYMPPEQAAGKAVDVRADVYAAGCLIFEMLSGRPPFLGEDNSEILRSHMLDPVPKLASVRSDVTVSPQLEALIEKAMAKVPSQRFANAGELLLALQELPKPPLWPKSQGAPDFRPSAATLTAVPAGASNAPLWISIAFGVALIVAGVVFAYTH